MTNWIEVVREGRSLSSQTRRQATDLESELSRLRAENATLRMEREILKKGRRSLPESSSEIRLCRLPQDSLPTWPAVPGAGGVGFRLP
ncbi:hypothetical protein GUL10_09700 [Stenotrophomonas maltophilia]|nr:hypothetical protein [Stenotrophomonas maltophilia]